MFLYQEYINPYRVYIAPYRVTGFAQGSNTTVGLLEGPWMLQSATNFPFAIDFPFPHSYITLETNSHSWINAYLKLLFPPKGLTVRLIWNIFGLLLKCVILCLVLWSFLGEGGSGDKKFHPQCHSTHSAQQFSPSPLTTIPPNLESSVYFNRILHFLCQSYY